VALDPYQSRFAYAEISSSGIQAPIEINLKPILAWLLFQKIGLTTVQRNVNLKNNFQKSHILDLIRFEHIRLVSSMTPMMDQ